jgi:hypothetical protein
MRTRGQRRTGTPVGLTTNCSPALSKTAAAICDPNGKPACPGSKAKISRILFLCASESESIDVLGTVPAGFGIPGVPYPGPARLPKGSPLSAVKTKREGDQLANTAILRHTDRHWAAKAGLRGELGIMRRVTRRQWTQRSIGQHSPACLTMRGAVCG